ncbi:MAG: GIDE domain-containing protein [Thermoplasmatota archaeon]
MAEIDEFLAFGGGILLFISIAAFFAYLIFRSFRKLRISLAMMRMRTSKIVTIRPGMVEIKGKAEPMDDRLLRSPVQGKHVLYYDLQLENFTPTSKGGYYSTIWNKSKGFSFFVNDGTGKIKIDPTRAEFILDSIVKENTRSSKGVSRQFVWFLQRMGKLRLDRYGYFTEHYRYTERILEPFRDVQILGRVVERSPGNEIDRGPGEIPYTINKVRERELFIISDKPEGIYVLKNVLLHSLVIISCCIGVLAMLSGIGLFFAAMFFF